ncbi:hypothetical protein SAMN06265349_105227 [Flavobacterium resistens]|uniref:DUF4062 domain-containing protein n=1 Tax=Flavobacterium resistens TaxID=443612 RepID=A0A521EQ58_9FLAO|nr:hypothetical protein [Flavobacterium resistens]MRX67852.1 hypothetical protein [Flavobacterium resistens]SMO86056.1 hypothetical protein SAMN06265349_105227 [Flavobacterium resistens]
MKSINQIKIFISCPGDIKEEIESIELIINEINKTSGKRDDYALELLNWKYDTYTDIGSDGQEVINNQLEHQYDILIGILGSRAGTPTKRDKSGTIEEINRAILDDSKEKMIYFKTSAPENIYDIDPKQLEILKLFKKELTEKGVLYKEFNSLDSFESLFRINLSNLIIDKILNKNKAIKNPIINKNTNKYSDIVDLISKIETKDDSNIEIDLFNLLGETTSYLEIITKTLDSMTGSLNFLTEKLNLRTEELNKIHHVKDQKLKQSKAIKSINDLSMELTEFSTRIDNDLPIFSENFKLVGSSYSKILLTLTGNKSNEVINMKNQMESFRNNVEFALKNSAILLQIVSDFPLMNSKFNHSKRQTEISIKNITKELLEGLLLFDEAMGIN